MFSQTVSKSELYDVKSLNEEYSSEECFSENGEEAGVLDNKNYVYLNSSEILSYNPKKKSPNKSKYRNIYCVNCGEKGHVVKDCDGPITSFGIIAFKIVQDKNDESFDTNSKLKEILSYNNVKDTNNENTFPKTKFLMIQRKDTMGFTDFVRGKYPDEPEESEKALQTDLNEMTEEEKNTLLTKSFDEIWRKLWVNHDSKCFKNEYEFAYRRYQKLDIPNLVKCSKTCYKYQEFGFPKGRRNMKETNIACAEREFYEETGYDKTCYDFIKNYPTIHEEFVGTNGVRYRHIYYLVKIKDNVPPPKIDFRNKVQTGEVQNIGWLTYEECMSVIRPYDIEKKKVIKKVYDDLLEMKNNYICSNFYYTGKKQYRSSPKRIPFKQNNYNSYNSSYNSYINSKSL
jgi:8-oxo-dGTP pyrophosphatase MutT (NUDIX family)